MIGGNYVVGVVVFAILMIINFVVVTKGAGRISEVSALHPGCHARQTQMAIDADLNAGLIEQEEARSAAARWPRRPTSTVRWTVPASSSAATPSPAC